MSRLLSLNKNAPGLMAAAGAVYAAVTLILHVVHHQAVLDPQVIVAAVAALAALFTRHVVTPVSDPRDASGKPMVTASQVAAARGRQAS